MKERWTARWFRKRALVYHVLVLILAPGCLWAGWWQIHRAESGNTLSYLYAVEWPIFAVLSIIGWWQLIHEDPAAVESRKVERARRAVERGPFIPPPAEAESGFYHSLETPHRESLGQAGGGGYDVVRRLTPDDGAGALDRLGPWTAPDDEPVATHALSSYNAYLARLSAGGGRKSWRDPHGVGPARRRADPASTLGAGEDEGTALDATRGREVGPGAQPSRRQGGRE